MNKKNIGLIILILCILFNTVYSFAEPVLPPAPKKVPVYDEMEVLSKSTISYVTDMNIKLKDTGAQIAVAVINNLGGYDIETYSNQLFRKWGIGSKEKNNGILLLVSMEEREIRIEVGYGLEGAINDAKAGRIVRDIIIPYFKNSQYDTGILEGFKAIVAYVQNEYNIELDENVNIDYYTSTQSDNNVTGTIIKIIIVILILIIFNIPRKGNRRRRSTFFGPFWGGGSGGGFGGFGGGSGGGFGGFGGGSSGGGGASGKW